MPRATTSFATTIKDQEHIVHAGDELPANHPVVKAHPELFEPTPEAKRAVTKTRSRKKTQ